MVIYTVESGDSLYSIARRYNTSVARLASDNGITTPATLSVGQSLVILQPTGEYTVESGDSLYSIAAKLGVSVNRLWRYNHYLGGGDRIVAGDKLITSLAPPEFSRTVSVTGYAYPFIDRHLLMSVLPYLTYLSVFTYGIAEDGSLIPPDSEEIVPIARRYGVAPIMMLTSLGENGTFSSELIGRVLSDETLYQKVLQGVEQAVVSGGYNGVEFDFEYIPAEYAGRYADMIEDAKRRLEPYGYVVFADLSPKTSDDQKGLLYEGHDYSDVGEAADKVLLMTYEYGYSYGPPMAVSPLPPIRRVLDYGTEEIAREKILLGVPNYGYNWTLPYTEGVRAPSLSNVDAVRLAAEKQARIMYDGQSEAPYFSYFEKQSGRAEEHTVWFEDARSADAMLRLINEYRLGGMGVWNIMRPFPQLWLVLDSLYNIEKVLR